jgi:hypothetical protein
MTPLVLLRNNSGTRAGELVHHTGPQDSKGSLRELERALRRTGCPLIPSSRPPRAGRKGVRGLRNSLLGVSNGLPDQISGLLDHRKAPRPGRNGRSVSRKAKKRGRTAIQR